MGKINLLLLISLAVLTSCDKVEHPVITQVPSGLEGLDWNLFPGGDPSTYVVPEFTPSPNNMRNVLLEDYTGHKCTNCPSANQTASNIAAANPGRVIVTSIHASSSGGFQATDAGHPIDFTPDAGDTYVNEMPGFFGNPSGTVNRRAMGVEESVWYFDFQWASEVANELAQENKVNLQVGTNYYPETNGLFIHTYTELKSPLNENYRMVISLLRKEVIAPQSLNDGTVDEEYEHHEVLSSTINGAWGTALRLDTMEVNEAVQHHFSYSLPDPIQEPTYQVQNLKLLVYVLDRQTFRIVQAIEKEL